MGLLQTGFGLSTFFGSQRPATSGDSIRSKHIQNPPSENKIDHRSVLNGEASRLASAQGQTNRPQDPGTVVSTMWSSSGQKPLLFNSKNLHPCLSNLHSQIETSPTTLGSPQFLLLQKRNATSSQDAPSTTSPPSPSRFGYCLQPRRPLPPWHSPCCFSPCLEKIR